MNHKEAFKALTSVQPARRNDAWGEGWRCHNEGYKVTLTNVKNGSEFVGYRDVLKSGKWSAVRWQ